MVVVLQLKAGLYLVRITTRFLLGRVLLKDPRIVTLDKTMTFG
jgi:hypothetical protein